MPATQEQITAHLINPTEVDVFGPQALADWREDTKLYMPGFEFMPQYRRRDRNGNRLWDGYYEPGRWIQPFGNNEYQFRCSRGLVNRLSLTFDVSRTDQLGKLKGCGWLPVSLDEIETWMKWVDQGGYTLPQPLRGFQREVLRSALQQGWGRIALATNAGKGAVIALMSLFALDHHQPVLILCDELAVFDALLGQLQEWGGGLPAVVNQGVKEPPPTSHVTHRNGDDIVLAMVPTLARRIKGRDANAIAWRKWLTTQTMVLLDEADKALTKSWRRVLGNTSNSHWRVGFSGSFPSPEEYPYTDLRLDEAMGPILWNVSNIELIEQEISARPTVHLYQWDITPALHHAPHKWWQASGSARRRAIYDRVITQNEARHRLITSILRPGVPSAIVVSRVAHGHALSRHIPNAVFLDGTKDSDVRIAKLEAFERGEFTVLIVTKILDRGTNRLGHVQDLLFVSGEGSTRQTLQRIGRGLRRADGKQHLRLVDIIDHVEPGSAQNRWLHVAANFLHSAAKKRIVLYAQEKFDVRIVKEEQ